MNWHTKTDSHLDRNYLKAALGDKMSALLNGIGYNFRMILNKLKLSKLKYHK